MTAPLWIPCLPLGSKLTGKVYMAASSWLHSLPGQPGTSHGAVATPWPAHPCRNSCKGSSSWEDDGFQTSYGLLRLPQPISRQPAGAVVKPEVQILQSQALSSWQHLCTCLCASTCGGRHSQGLVSRGLSAWQLCCAVPSLGILVAGTLLLPTPNYLPTGLPTQPCVFPADDRYLQQMTAFVAT